MTESNGKTRRITSSRMPAKFVTTCVYFGRPPFSGRDKNNTSSTPSEIMAVQPCQQFSLGDDIDLINLIPFSRQHK